MDTEGDRMIPRVPLRGALHAHPAVLEGILVHHRWISAQTDNKLGTDLRIIRHAIRTREVWKPCRRSGRLASPPAIERRVYCGSAPSLPARRPEGDRTCAPNTARRVLEDFGAV